MLLLPDFYRGEDTFKIGDMTRRIGLISLSFVLLGCWSKETTQGKESEKTLQILSSEVYTTNSGNQTKLQLTNNNLWFDKRVQPLENQAGIYVNTTKEFQTLLGIGAALTDAAAETFYQLPQEEQNRFMQAYFDTEKGIGYSLARTIIHSCDFSSESYTYVDEGDKELTTFSIEHDKKYRLPFTKRAIEVADGKLTMYASPWSPPAFMKTNGSMLQGGKLRPEYYQSWANYYVKFIQAYEAEGIPIWGVSIQNEPMAVQRWESCIYTAEEERDFLKNYLGPTFEKNGFSNKKIIVWDHNRDLLYERANVILSDEQASKYVWGVGFHWYEDWKDGKPMFNNVNKVHQEYPDVNLIFTEGCNERFDRERINDPKLPERYALAMINDFNNGTVAWTDWNILLNEKGGPNHVGNYCFAPVHGDTQSGELFFSNSYYYIGHFSKFIRPGAKRISSGTTSNQISATAFRNEDGSLVVVALNTSETPLNYFLTIDDKTAELQINAHAIQTIILNSNNQ